MAKLCSVNRISHLLDRKTLLTVINCLVFSKLFYCSCIWAGNSMKNIAKLQQVQNFAARIVADKRKLDHITPTTLKDLKI